mgnify:CR=1 FL=1
MKKIEAKPWLFSIALVVLASLFPVIFTYAQNVSEVDFIEVLSLALLYPAVGFFMWGGFSLITKSPMRSALSTVLLVFFLSNYMMVQNVVQMVFADLKYWHILPLALFIIGHIVYLIFRFEEKSFKDIMFVGVLVMSVLMLINLVPAVPTIVQKMASNSGESSNSSSAEESEQPNIYWFVFDECASFPVMEKHYGYTDTTFQDYLTEKGFFISHSSRNESGNTNSVLTNCLNLDYVVNSDMPLSEIETYTVDPAMYELLRENNYQIKGVGDTMWLGGIESVTQSGGAGGGQTVEGITVSEMILQNSVIAPFMVQDGTAAAKVILDSYAYLQDSNNIEPNTATFTLCYLCTPHQPFLFDENGDSVSASNYNNWDDPKYYLGQYIFAMKNLTQMVECILEKDSDSIIVVQSDHGPRFKDGMTFEERTNVLNAVYYRNEDMSQIDGKSSVNTFRLIFSKLFDVDLKEVPVHYEN